MSEEHARLSPSSSNAWVACAAYPNLNYGKDEESASESSLRGTAAHALLEYLMNEYGKVGALPQVTEFTDTENKITLDPEDIIAVYEAADYLVSLNCDHFEIETRVDPGKTFGREDCWGTADFIGIKGDTLYVYDYKNGSGVLVECDSNNQIILYALGALQEDKFKHATKVVTGIIQPKIPHTNGPIRHVQYTADEVRSCVSFYSEKAAATDAAYPKRVPGESQCRWCKDIRCTARAAENMKNTLAVFNPETLAVQEASLMREPQSLTLEQIATIEENRNLVKGWLDAVHEYAVGQALAGAQIPGYKLVAGRKSSSFVFDEETTIKKLKSKKKKDGSKVGVKDIMNTTLKSPAQIRNALKLVTDTKVFKSTMEVLVKESEGKPTLAPVSDHRPALPSKVEQAFAGIDTTSESADTPDLTFLS